MPPDTGFRGRAIATAIAAAGIALGTSVMIASLAVGRGVERSIESMVEATLGRADFRVSASGNGVVSDEMLVTIRSVFGVAVAAPAVEQRTTLIPEGDTGARSREPVTMLGIDPLLDGQVHDLDLVAGTSLTRRDEAAAIITESLAASDGYGLGSDVIVATPGEPERFRVIGIAAGDGSLVMAGGRTVILPIDAVSRMFGLDGVAWVDVLVEDGIPLTGVQSELGEALATEPHVLTSPAGLVESLRSSTTGFAGTVAGMAAVGLVAGALLVFLAVWLTFPARGAIGLQREVRGVAVLGAIGSVLGVALGTALAALTTLDVVPAAAGLGGIAVPIGVALLVAVAAEALPSHARLARSALEAERAQTALAVGILAIGLGLVVEVAMVGANLRHAAVEPSLAPVPGRVVAPIDALALLAGAVAVLGIVVAVAVGARGWAAPVAGVVGFAGASVGSILGLLAGAAAILLGGRAIDLTADFPWAAIGLSLALGIGLAPFAWVARLAGRLSTVRRVRIE